MSKFSPLLKLIHFLKNKNYNQAPDKFKEAAELNPNNKVYMSNIESAVDEKKIVQYDIIYLIA